MKKKYEILVYIAGKLNAPNACDYIKNVSAMLRIAEVVRREGFSVYTPCNDILNGIVNGGLEYGDYATSNMEIAKRSDALFLVPGWRESPGTNNEITQTNTKGIPYFETINTLNEWYDETHRRPKSPRQVARMLCGYGPYFAES